MAFDDGLDQELDDLAPDRSSKKSIAQLNLERNAVKNWVETVNAAARGFEARWTMLALKRVDAELHQALQEQIGMFNEVLVTGKSDEIVEHGAATCRGWVAACKAMENEPDDSYLVGYDVISGRRIAIGNHKSADRVKDIYGNDCVFYTADEIAGLLGVDGGVGRVADVKKIWPGAEVVEVRQ